MIRKDLTGQRFNKLVVLEFIRMNGNHSIYKCICDCGNETVAYAGNLKKNHTSSCGCLSVENKKKFGESGLTHGLSKHPLFVSWIGMRNRCYFKKHNRYKYYGEKGIIVCDEWKDDFMAFYNWGINNGWEKGLSIDREDSKKNYCPYNCKFSTSPEQNRNKTNNVNITYKGVTKVATDWAKVTGVNPQTIADRFRKGWDIKDVIYGRPKPVY